MSITLEGRLSDRRAFLARASAAAAALAAGHLTSRSPVWADDSAAVPEPTERQIRDYLRPLLPAREDVDAWLAGQAFPFSKYDSHLGYLHTDRDFQEGQDGAICQYRYDALDARRMFAYADRPCRINTYGDSFTSCEQVSDGETWQEVLARHLGEPIRNYGIGGYSVYQAYLRMLREEERSPAQYIVFNIYDDDHARNLLGWQRFKFGVNRKGFNGAIPHVTVDLDAGAITDRLNPCPTPEIVHELCDLDSAYRLFRDDFMLHNRIQREVRSARGEPVPPRDYDDEHLIRHGIFASSRIIERIEDFARKTGKQVLYVLSYGAYTIRQFIDTGTRFDQALVEFLDTSGLPYVDVMQAHAADAKLFKVPTDEYLARYFIGHYNPLGNVFCALAMKDALVSRLNPKPPAYAR